MTTIYFATNRNPNNHTNPTNFGNAFSEKGLSELRFGRADVDRGTLKSIEVLPDNADLGSKVLLDQLRQSMKADKTDSLVFIHGFNVSFKDALKSAGKLSDFYRKVSDDQYNPNIFVFSWPSNGQVTDYSNDRHDAETSGYAFARGLMKLANFLSCVNSKDICHQKINLMAHSMGNYVLRHALQQAKKISGSVPLNRLFDNIILTAADEDNDAFDYDHKMAQLSNLAQRITVYFNSGDVALKVSDYTKGNPDRLGHDGPSKPHQVPGKVVLVDVSDIVTGISEHSYHQEDKRVAQDMIGVLQGKKSEELARVYVSHANKFRLV